MTPDDATAQPSPHAHLLGGFRRHVGRLAPGADAGDVAALGARVLARWEEPHRRYHDATHLAEVLAAVALLSEHAGDLPVVVAAAWWHDSVYDVSAAPGASESASADLAVADLTALGVPAERADRVADLVRVTADHDPAPGDVDAAVLCDADLSVLGSTPERYAQYAAAVRHEYAHVPDDAFAAGRAQVLQSLLVHPRLYRTPTARELFEARARDNVQRELDALTGSAPAS